MSVRAIVRDADMLSGRWRFAGTTIPIAAIRSDLQFGRAETLRQYTFMHLTDAEIDAVLAFPFPEIRETRIVVQYASVTVNCACGEDIHRAAERPMHDVIACVCGRNWRLSVSPALAGQPSAI